jgi:hypothetical protein
MKGDSSTSPVRGRAQTPRAPLGELSNRGNNIDSPQTPRSTPRSRYQDVPKSTYKSPELPNHEFQKVRDSIKARASNTNLHRAPSNIKIPQPGNENHKLFDLSAGGSDSSRPNSPETPTPISTAKYNNAREQLLPSSPETPVALIHSDYDELNQRQSTTYTETSDPPRQSEDSVDERRSQPRPQGRAGHRHEILSSPDERQSQARPQGRAGYRPDEARPEIEGKRGGASIPRTDSGAGSLRRLPTSSEEPKSSSSPYQPIEERGAGNRESIMSCSTNASGGGRRKVMVGHWRLGRTLGKGSSGRVRLAKHAFTGQYAAVKIVGKDSNAVLLSNKELGKIDMSKAQNKVLPFGIEREVVIMKLIEHPNVMSLYDVWENRGEL